MNAWVAAHRKLLAGVAGFALTFAVLMWGTDNPYVALAVGAASCLGIERVPNTPPRLTPAC